MKTSEEIFPVETNNQIIETDIVKESMITKKESQEREFSVLLSSHQSLVEYFPLSNKFKTIDTDHGVYYGFTVFSTDELYVTGSPKYTEPKERLPKDRKHDSLMRLNLQTMKVDTSDTINIDSFFTHDSIAYKGKILIANTFKGSLDVYTRDKETFVIQDSITFGKKSHVNSISSHDDYVFVLLNNLGSSQVAVLNKFEQECLVNGIGSNNHNLIFDGIDEQGFVSFYSLSSNEEKLVKILFSLSQCKDANQISATKEILHKYEHASMSKPFLKGLMVVNDVALFGVSQYTASRKARSSVNARLVAFDLSSKSIIFDRDSSKTGSKGIINVIGSPFSCLSSTFSRITLSGNPFVDSQKTTSKQVSKGYDYTDNLLEFSRITGIDYGFTQNGVYFIKLPLQLDVEQLKADLDFLLTRTKWTFREDVNNYFLLLITNKGRLTDESKVGPFVPIGGRLDKIPYTKKVMASIGAPIGRSRYMMLPGGQSVNLHKDRVAHVYKRKGNRRKQSSSEFSRITELFGNGFRGNPNAGYWGRRFRVHVPVYSNSKVVFKSEDVSFYMEPGYIYLFDNASPHEVINPSTEERTHLVFDTVSSPILFELVCNGHVITKEDGSKAPKEVPFLEFYEREYKTIFGNSNDEIQKLKHTTLKISSVEPKIYYEQWIDKEVFQPMSPFELSSNWNHLVSSLATALEKNKLAPLFDRFIRKYEDHCFTPFKSENEYIGNCEDVISSFVKTLSSEPTLGPTQSYNFEIDLFSAIEALLKSAFYECSDEKRMFQKGPKCL